MGRRRFQADQGHTQADLNALAAVRDTLQIVARTPDPKETKKRRAVEILKKLYEERKIDLDRAFIYEDAYRILLRP